MHTNNVTFIDTHCHIHDRAFSDKFDVSPDDLVDDSLRHGVSILMCVGTDSSSSKQAVDFSARHDQCYSSVALHPHEASLYTLKELTRQMAELRTLISDERKNVDLQCKIIAIGECGLDYFYHEKPSDREKQELLFRQHIELAMEFDLPLIFHIRDAFDDFFRIIDEYKVSHGVVHSFSAGEEELRGVLKRGFYVGLNGIQTFTRDQRQIEAAKLVPIERMVLETDAPFLTPKPLRGKMCKPKYIRHTAEYLSLLRGEDVAFIANKTSENARHVFRF